jgi:hypothetical protein
MREIYAEVRGACPFWNGELRCRLSDSIESTGTIDYNCKSDTNCKSCANYEAWKSGRSYTDVVAR